MPIQEKNIANLSHQDILKNINEFEEYESIVPNMKRLDFIHADNYKVGEEDWYGNIIIYTPHPKGLFALCVRLVWDKMDLGEDRYSAILLVRELIRNCKSEQEVIEKIKGLYSL